MERSFLGLVYYVARLCLLMLSVACWEFSLTSCSDAQVVQNPQIPGLAYRLKRQVRAEVNYHWGIEQEGSVFYAQVHQESSWNPEAQSKYASGLAQFTPATAEWIGKLYPKDLGEVNPLDTRWAIRACVKYDLFLYNKFPLAISKDDRWAFTLSSYNSGYGWTLKERASAEAKGKDKEQWWCSVQHEVVKAQWAFDESRGYVEKVLFKWRPLYRVAGFI